MYPAHTSLKPTTIAFANHRCLFGKRLSSLFPHCVYVLTTKGHQCQIKFHQNILCLQEFNPMTFNKVHVVNSPKLVGRLYQVVKPFLGKTIRSKVHFHDSLESLHEHVWATIPAHITMQTPLNKRACNAMFSAQTRDQ